jgi:hypothetical protein
MALTTAEFSVLGVEAVGDQAKFLDGVQVRNQASTEVAALAYVPAVHEEGVGGFALAVHGDISRVQNTGYRAVLLDGLGAAGRDTGLQAEEIDITATVQGQGQHFLGIDDVAELRVLGLHLNGVGDDLHFVGHTSDFERHVVL